MADPNKIAVKRPLSEARLMANRQNALRSTGPRTVSGKSRSSQNALKHGLTSRALPKLSPDRIAALEDAAAADFGAADPGLATTVIAELARISMIRDRRQAMLQSEVLRILSASPDLSASQAQAIAMVQIIEHLNRLTD
jgi:hypothetical protein